MTRLTIAQIHQGKRLDAFLAEEKITPSRSQAARWIAFGAVTLDGKPLKAAYRMQGGEEIEVVPPALVTSDLNPEEIPLQILFEDKDVAVLNKPAGLSVHPGAKKGEVTLVHALLCHFKGLSQIGGVERPGIVHRLDKGTSGAMVVAKNDEAHIGLARQFKDHEVKKTYWAIVYGKFAKKKGTIVTLLTRSSKDRKKFASHKTKGKESVTHYRVLEEAGSFSLVEVMIDTGRTHQIRVHLSESGHGLVGDVAYGGHLRLKKQFRDKKISQSLQETNRPMLHARKVGFAHPLSKKQMEFEAALPADFEKNLKALGLVHP